MKKINIKRRITITAAACLLAMTHPILAQDTKPAATTDATAEVSSADPQVVLVTSVGEIVLELYPDKAPESVKNFLQYVEEGFYTGTIFHRVIKDFMMQGGGYDEEFEKKETRPAIQNEADNELKNDKYTIAMARTQAPHSATAQFFINTANNEFLNHQGKNRTGWGYTVFGRVIEGQDITEWIGNVPTGASGPFPKDVPVAPITIKKATLRVAE